MIINLLVLVNFFVLLGASACKPKPDQGADSQSMRLVPADKQKGGVLHTLAMSRLVIQQIEEKANFRPERMTRLPADFREWFFEIGEDKGYDYDFRREKTLKWGKPHECWYLLKKSRTNLQQIGPATVLTPGIVNVDAAFNRARQLFEEDPKEFFKRDEYTNAAAWLKSGELYGWLEGMESKRAVSGTMFTIFLLSYYLPAAIEKSQSSWTKCQAVQ